MFKQELSMHVHLFLCRLALLTGLLLATSLITNNILMAQNETKIELPASFENYGDYKKELSYFRASDGYKMAFLDLGDKNKEAIMLVHGVPMSSWLYRKIAAALEASGKYRVIVPDMLGYGASDKPNKKELYSPAAHGKRLNELADHLNLKKWTHVVHDAGGPWSFEMITQQPERIKRLVLLNTILYKEGFEPPMYLKENMIGKSYASLYNGGAAAKAMIRMTLKNGTNQCPLTKQEIKGHIKAIKGSRTAIYKFFTGLKDIEARLPVYQSTLKSLNVPISVIWGSGDDILVGKEQIPLIQENLGVSDANIHSIIGGVHFIQEERPGDIASYIMNFMKKK